MATWYWCRIQSYAVYSDEAEWSLIHRYQHNTTRSERIPQHPRDDRETLASWSEQLVRECCQRFRPWAVLAPLHATTTAELRPPPSPRCRTSSSPSPSYHFILTERTERSQANVTSVYHSGPTSRWWSLSSGSGVVYCWWLLQRSATTPAEMPKLRL